MYLYLNSVIVSFRHVFVISALRSEGLKRLFDLIDFRTSTMSTGKILVKGLFIASTFKVELL